MGSPAFIPTQPQGMAITNEEIARRRMMNPFAMGAQTPAQTPLAPTQVNAAAPAQVNPAPQPRAGGEDYSRFIHPFVGNGPIGQGAVQTVPAGTQISPPSGMAPVQAPSMPPTDAGQATALQGLAPMGDPMENVQHTPGHLENATAISNRIAQRGAEPVNPNTVTGAHHGFRKALDVLGGMAMGAATFNPMAGIGMYRMLHNAPLNRAQAAWQSQNASDEKQLGNERELANSETSYDKMQATDRFHQGELSARDRRITDLETSASASPKAGTEMQDPTSPTGYTAEYADGKRRPYDPKKGDEYKGMDEKHWENVLNDPNASPADKKRAQAFLKTEAGQKRAGRTQVNVGDGMSAGEKRDLDASTRNIAKQRDDKKAELHAMMANPIFDENDPKITQLRQEIADLDQQYETAYEAHSHHGGAKAGGGKQQPAQSPQTHVFSKAAWLKNNPQGDVNTVAAQAKQSGYEVTD